MDQELVFVLTVEDQEAALALENNVMTNTIINREYFIIFALSTSDAG